MLIFHSNDWEAALIKNGYFYEEVTDVMHSQLVKETIVNFLKNENTYVDTYFELNEITIYTSKVERTS